MIRSTCLVVASTLLVFPLLAQDPAATDQGAGPQMGAPDPAPQTAAFDKLLGHWQGRGTAVMVPGAQESPWTGSTSSRRILDGHFVEELARVDVGPDMPPLYWRSLYGYDVERGKHVGLGISNTGEVFHTDLVFSDPNTLVAASAAHREGEPTIELTKTTFGDGSMAFTMWQASPSKGMFEHVSGSYRKVDVLEASMPKTADVAPFAPVPAEMQSLASVAGTYRITGEMMPVPGAPMVDITGTEEVSVLFGGSVIQFDVRGDPIPGMDKAYRGISWIAWSQAKGAYASAMADNMGMSQAWDGHLVDGDIVFTGSQRFMGKPQAVRVVIHRDGEGRMTRVVGHVLHATEEPVKTFDATYTHQGG